MFSYRFHLLIIRKKWIELSPNPSFILKLIDFSNNCNNFFLIFEPTIFSTKFIYVFFQFSFKTLLSIFGALLCMASGAKLSFACVMKFEVNFSKK